jgi:ABC-type nitrate/sulfonate/bicarbonate transport system ATPase subunit
MVSMQPATRVPKLDVRSVAMVFQADTGKVDALSPVSFALEAGSFVSVIGPSGCGKSTLFNIIAGLQRPSHGAVAIDGEDATGTIGRVGYMMQKDLLLPWRTVIDNVILGMEIKGTPRKSARSAARPLLARYGLGGFEDSYPNQLSGGMRQRAGLLRTLLLDSDIVLLDEPFGALDAQTKASMQEWLLQLWSDFRKTVVFITHDVEEAIYLADQILVMSARPGRIVDRIAVPLARPRPRSAVSAAAFIELKERCLAHLSEAAADRAA